MYYEAADTTVLIDPLVPAGEEDELFRHLDADVARRGLPVVILLTAEWHRRSADELAARYGARIGGDLPDGIEEIPIGRSPALERPDELEASLDRLMELPIERLLVSHGEPVLEDARTRMAEALARS